MSQNRHVPTSNVDGTLVQVSNQARILGVTLDSRLQFDAHISALSKPCFHRIRALRHNRSNLTPNCSKNIACSLVGCRLDYANSTLVVISLRNISRLKYFASTLARVVAFQRGYICISESLQELYWLPIKYRIDYQDATLTYKLLESGKPTCLRSSITSKTFRRSLRSTVDDRQREPCSFRTKIGSHAFVVPPIDLELPAV